MVGQPEDEVLQRPRPSSRREEVRRASCLVVDLLCRNEGEAVKKKDKGSSFLLELGEVFVKVQPCPVISDIGANCLV